MGDIFQPWYATLRPHGYTLHRLLEIILENILFGRKDASEEQMIRAGVSYLDALRRNKRYENRLQPPYKNNMPRCSASGLLIEAAKKANCHDFIMKLPQGYVTVAGEADSTPSGGEKQWIAIAWVVLKDMRHTL